MLSIDAFVPMTSSSQALASRTGGGRRTRESRPSFSPAKLFATIITRGAKKDSGLTNFLRQVQKGAFWVAAQLCGAPAPGLPCGGPERGCPDHIGFATIRASDEEQSLPTSSQVLATVVEFCA